MKNPKICTSVLNIRFERKIEYSWKKESHWTIVSNKFSFIFQFNQFIDLPRRIKFFTRCAFENVSHPPPPLYNERIGGKGCKGRSSAKLLQGFTLIWSTVWEIVKTVRDEDGLKQGREGITKSRMRLGGFPPPLPAPCGKFFLTTFHLVFLNFALCLYHSLILRLTHSSWIRGQGGGQWMRRIERGEIYVAAI